MELLKQSVFAGFRNLTIEINSELESDKLADIFYVYYTKLSLKLNDNISYEEFEDFSFSAPTLKREMTRFYLSFLIHCSIYPKSISKTISFDEKLNDFDYKKVEKKHNPYLNYLILLDTQIGFDMFVNCLDAKIPNDIVINKETFKLDMFNALSEFFYRLYSNISFNQLFIKLVKETENIITKKFIDTFEYQKLVIYLDATIDMIMFNGIEYNFCEIYEIKLNNLKNVESMDFLNKTYPNNRANEMTMLISNHIYASTIKGKIQDKETIREKTLDAVKYVRKTQIMYYKELKTLFNDCSMFM